MALALVAALAGVDMAVCLVVLMFAPAVTVVGYEVLGHRYQAEALLLSATSDARFRKVRGR